MREGPTHDTWVRQCVLDQPEGMSRRKGVGVQEEKDRALGAGRAGVHQLGTAGTRGPEQLRAANGSAFSAGAIAGSRDDDLHRLHARQVAQMFQGASQSCGVVSYRDDDRDARPL